jgi:hypothetical protein
MVQAEVNGKGELTRIKIDPSAAEDIELLEDTVVAAVSAASAKAAEAMKQEMSQLTGGMDIPGLSDLMGGGK